MWAGAGNRISIRAGLALLLPTALFAPHVAQLPDRESHRQHAKEKNFDQQVHG